MALRPTVSIPIDTSDFDRFHALFTQYQDELAKQPAAWAAVGSEITGAAEGFAGMTAALLAQRELYHEEEQALKKQNDAQKQLLDTERKRKTETVAIWQNTKKIAASVASTTLDVLKWVGIEGLVGGLIGAAGLFGLDSLARSAGATRRGALGVGVSPGEYQASKIAFGPWINPESNLENIANATSDLGKGWIWRALGVNPNQNGLDRQEAIFQRARTIAATTDPRQLVQTAQRTGLTDLGFSLDDLRALARMDKEDLRLHAENLAAARSQISLSNSVARQWRQMDVVLNRSKLVVENALLNGLAPLTPVLAKFSEAVAQAITVFFKTHDVEKGVEEFAGVIGRVANYLASPDFQGDLKSFATNVGLVAQGLVNALRFFHLIPEVATGGTVDAPSLADKQAGLILGGSQVDKEKRTAAFLMGQGWTAPQAAGIIANLEAESGLNPFAQGDKNKAGQLTAYGIGQWHADRQRAYAEFFGHSIQSVRDPSRALAEQLEFVQHELRAGAYKQAGMDLALDRSARAAGYDVSRLYERPGGGTKEAVRRGDAAVRIQLVISNPAGAHIAVQANQLVH